MAGGAVGPGADGAPRRVAVEAAAGRPAQVDRGDRSLVERRGGDVVRQGMAAGGGDAVQGEGVVLTHGIAQIDVRGDSVARFFGDGARNFYVQQFNQLIQEKKKDYLEKKDIPSDGNSQFLRGLFALADRDGDGKLTLKELNAFFDAIGGGASAFATLTVADHGAGLFELLDANRDGRLSIRELRTGWERVAPWDKDKAGTIGREQIPRQYQLTVRQGPADDGRFRNVARGMNNQQRPGNTGAARCGSARWTATATATCRAASGWAAWRTSRRSTPTVTA